MEGFVFLLKKKTASGLRISIVGSEMCIFFFKQKPAYEVRLGLVGSGMCIRDRFGGGLGKMEPRSGLDPLTCGRLRRLTRFGVRGGFAARVGVGLSGADERTRTADLRGTASPGPVGGAAGPHAPPAAAAMCSVWS